MGCPLVRRCIPSQLEGPGKVDDSLLLDLNFQEDSRGLGEKMLPACANLTVLCADLPVAITPSDGRLVMCQMDSKIPIADFSAVLKLAVEGAKQIAELMRTALRERAAVLSEAQAQSIATQAGRMDEGDHDD
jgi:hypothetical protein